MRKPKLLTDDQFNAIAKQLDKTPSILIAGCDDGSPHFQVIPYKDGIITSFLIALMKDSPYFAKCVKEAAIAHSVKKTMN